MTRAELLLILRENHKEIISRWLENCSGRIAEEFVQMLKTPMGRSIGSSMYELAMRFLEAEEYEVSNIQREIREYASNSSFRRAAVGFSLPDIVSTAIAFREALQQTLLNHFCAGESGSEELLNCFIRLTRLGDAMVEGEVDGFFAFSNFGEQDDGVAEAV